MKDPMRLVDRFLYKHPNFGIPGLARYLAVGTGAAWVIGLINSVLYAYLSFSAAAVLHGQVWRLVSFSRRAEGRRLLICSTLAHQMTPSWP